MTASDTDDDTEGIVAMLGGPASSYIDIDQLSEIEEWWCEQHYKTHGFTLILAGRGPVWGLCMDCEYSEDLPQEKHEVIVQEAKKAKARKVDHESITTRGDVKPEDTKRPCSGGNIS